MKIENEYQYFCIDIHLTGIQKYMMGITSIQFPGVPAKEGKERGLCFRKRDKPFILVMDGY